tara:strand:- start:3428 stop:3646 length:219 start_codon:yes stop_codon:yes gene_type:complete
MMTSPEDKQRWKKESAQLKEDLKNRKKVVKTREVPITFPGKKTSKNKTSPNNTLHGSEKTDAYFRGQINIES